MSLFKDYLDQKITDQDVFNHVYHQIILQNEPANSGTANVLLNPATGCKCALGHLLSDAELDVIQDKGNSYAIGVNGICMFLGYDMGFVYNGSWDHRHGFLHELRLAHDRVSTETDFIHSFKGRMKQIADTYNLTVPGE
jgi:hypothetical protein